MDVIICKSAYYAFECVNQFFGLAVLKATWSKEPTLEP